MSGWGSEGRFLLHSSLWLVRGVSVCQRCNVQCWASCLCPSVSCRLKAPTLCQPSWTAWCISPLVRFIPFSSAVCCQVTTLGWPWLITPCQCDLWDSIPVYTRKTWSSFVLDLLRSEDAAYFLGGEESTRENVNVFHVVCWVWTSNMDQRGPVYCFLMTLVAFSRRTPQVRLWHYSCQELQRAEVQVSMVYVCVCVCLYSQR